MTDSGMVDRMQIIASGPTEILYFDASETQSFYLYNIVDKTAQLQSSVQAQAWFNTGNATFMLPGLTAWGLSLNNQRLSIQTFKQPPPSEGTFTLDVSELGGPDELG